MAAEAINRKVVRLAFKNDLEADANHKSGWRKFGANGLTHFVKRQAVPTAPKGRP
jgi:hypothetical protein